MMVTKLIQAVGISIVNNKVLVGDKLKGIAKNVVNFPGGNYEPGEDENLDACLVRECKEEFGIEVTNSRKLGIVTFSFIGKPFEVELHIYRIDSYSGTPINIEGQDIMNPRYEPINLELYSKMWAGDALWLPFVIENKMFKGTGLYENPKKLLEHNIHEVPSL